jgi:hypothetical protein
VTKSWGELAKEMDLSILDKLICAWGELDTMIQKRKSDLAESLATTVSGPPVKKKKRSSLKEKWG